MKGQSGRIAAARRALAILVLPALALSTLCSCDGAKAQPARPKAATKTADGQQREGYDWPRFLGPDGTGVSDETDLLETWPKHGPPIVWEKGIGSGYSAPSIRGERLVVHHRLRGEEIVECFHPATGKPLWRHAYPSRFSDPYGYNNGPRCTPLLTNDRCYTLGAEGKLLCLDLQAGEPLWQHDLLQEFDLVDEQTGQPNWFFGMGCTPILDDGLLFVLVGGQPNSGVVAFDAATGKIKWQAVGKETWDGVTTDWPGQEKYEWTGNEHVVSYSSPIIATIHGKKHLLCLVRHGLVSLDPTTGRENFKYWFCSRAHDSVNAARPVVIGDRILLSAAYRVGSALLKVHNDGTSYDVVWRNPRNLLAHWSTPIHVDGYVYGFSGRHENEGELRCIELETGKILWTSTGLIGDLSDYARDPLTGGIVDAATGKPAPWPFYGRGSKIRIGERFIVLGERGTLALVNVNPQRWEELARASYEQIEFPSWTAPVLSRKRLYLRDENSLLCLDLSPESKTP